MLTQQQYDKLIPHKAVITFVAEGGSHNVPQDIYDMAGELNLGPLDMFCNNCKINYITDLYNLMKEYEDGKG